MDRCPQGGFDPDSSDVDFLVVTDGALHESDLDALRQMHEGLARSGLPYATELEGSYPSKGRFLHPEQNRAIILREAALLQSFPPDYEFPLERGQLGDVVGAVPLPGKRQRVARNGAEPGPVERVVNLRPDALDHHDY